MQEWEWWELLCLVPRNRKSGKFRVKGGRCEVGVAVGHIEYRYVILCTRCSFQTSARRGISHAVSCSTRRSCGSQVSTLWHLGQSNKPPPSSEPGGCGGRGGLEKWFKWFVTKQAVIRMIKKPRHACCTYVLQCLSLYLVTNNIHAHGG